MKKRSLIRFPLRWFLLLWVGIVVAESLIVGEVGAQNAILFVLAPPSAPSNVHPVIQGVKPATGAIALPAPPSAPSNVHPVTQGVKSTLPTRPIIWFTLLFLLLVALYSFLLWKGLSGQISPRFFWPYFLFQGVLVLAMQLVVRQPNLMLNLYLALTLCALAMLKRVAPVLLVATSYLLLFWVSLSMNMPSALPGNQPVLLWFNILSFSDPMTLFFFLAGYLIVYRQQSSSQAQLEQVHTELQGAYSRLAASTRQIETLTLLAERQRMARELHDTLAQGIAGMIMQLEVASAQVNRKNYAQAQQILSQTLLCARTTLQDARHAITDLRSRTPRIDQLVESVQEEIAHFFQTTGVPCHAELGDLVHTPSHHCEQVLRVIREGLNNVARHAQAQQVKVEARGVERWLEISVQDDGRGFHSSNQDLRIGHYGLLGLQERAHLVGGTLSITSSEGEGTTLRFRVPLAVSLTPAPPLKQEGQSSLTDAEETYG
jgi:NarL family two-component system sensor histidine kinase YdfH